MKMTNLQELTMQEQIEPNQAAKVQSKDLSSEIITWGQLDDILEKAIMLCKVGEIKKDRTVGLEQIASSEKVSVQKLYELADEIDLPREYVDKARNVYYPSAEVQLEDIKKYGAKPMVELIRKLYLQKLKESIEAFPGVTFRVRNIPTKFDSKYFNRFYGVTMITTKETYKKGLFGRIKKLNKEEMCSLAVIDSNCLPLTVEFYIASPLFLRLFGESLDKIKQQLNNGLDLDIKYKFEYDYPIEIK